MKMTREEVISALKIEVKDFYENNGNELGDDSVVMDITTIENALALLEAQETRVLTMDEVKNLNRNEVVWLEDIGKAEIIPGIVKGRQVWPFTTMQVTNFMRCDGCTITSYDGDYNIRWRAWTSLPTEEQREAASWK